MTLYFDESISSKRTPLINRVPPNQGESLYSFMFRNAEANYFESLGIMLKDELKSCNIYWYHYNYLDFDKKWTKVISNFVEEEILYKDINKLCLNQYDEIIFGDKTPTKVEKDYYYVKSQAKYCPLCFCEHKHYKLIWDFSFITTCPKHKVNLINICKSCQKPIKIGQLMQNHCQCGSCYSSQIYDLVKPDEDILQTQIYIHNLLLHEKRLDSPPNEFKSSKDYFYCFRLLINTLLNLPIKTIFDSKHLSIDNFDWWDIKHDILTMSFIVNAIHQTIMFPDIFIPKIMGVIDKYKENTSASKRKYKFIQKFLEIQKTKGSTQLIHTDENNYIIQSETKLRTDRQSKNGLHTLNNKGKATRRPLFKEDDVLSLIEKDEFVSLNTLSSYIGLHRGQCRKLVEKEIILGHVKLQNGEKKNIWLLDRKDMESYFNSFFNKIPNVSFVDKSEYISFYQAIPKLKNFSIDSSSLINLLNKDKFQAFLLNGERSIENIYINLEQVKSYMEKLRLIKNL
ncbi:TniQ protein [Peribacillus simplex]|uniref:TniQ protein n=1 Tax=Peribacillus simplex TaxID=1478 RepID=A0A9X8R427_9BACI|nr:TniQ family protein [Peribacillus simplex]SIQ29429.1 TniQ protein [Peribacillus simplex]